MGGPAGPADQGRRVSAVLYASVDSPIGDLLLTGDGHALHGLHMTEGRRPVGIDPAWRRSAEAFAAVRAQLTEYFAGERTRFEVVLDMAGTPFQRRVWTELEAIPYGTTITIRVTAQFAAGRFIRLKVVRSGSRLSEQVFCMRPGSKKLRKRGCV